MNPTLQKTTIRILGFVVSIILVIIGLLLMRQQEFVPGIIILACSLVLLPYSVHAIETHPLTDEESVTLKPYLFPTLFMLASIIITSVLVINITEFPRTTWLNRMAAAEWVAAIITLVVGVIWAVHWKGIRLRLVLEWMKANRIELGLVVMLMLAGLTIRMVALTEHPYPWSGDEASIGMEARRLIHGDNTDIFNTGWSGQPNVSFLPTAFSMLIFGENFFAIKMMSVVIGTLSVLGLYLLAREWFGKEIALIASGFLVAYPVHLQFSRMGVDNIYDSLMIALVLWSIFYALRRHTFPAYLMAGLITGFTLYTYVGTRLALAIGIGAILVICIKQKGFLRRSWYYLGIFLAGLVVVIAPMATFFIRNPQLFMTRIGQEGILLNGWLPRQVELTGQSPWQILLQQFSRTVLVFFAQEANGNFLNFDRPYLTILGAIFFMIGFAVSIRHLSDQRQIILQAWFWSVLALGGFLTVNPPANTRLVMTIPAVCIFIGQGAWEVSRVLRQLKFSPVLITGLLTALLLILAFQNLSFYFGSYRTEDRFQDANGELAQETGLQLQKLGRHYDYYLLGLPRVFAAFPTTDFLAPQNQKTDLPAETIPGLSLDPARGAFIVAIPENQELLQQIADAHPGGVWESVPRKVRNEVLYYAYTLAPNTSSAP
jgi:4-amino-4-deoxy-L-arabinose transferase-like glycosyltransferase